MEALFLAIFSSAWNPQRRPSQQIGVELFTTTDIVTPYKSALLDELMCLLLKSWPNVVVDQCGAATDLLCLTYFSLVYIKCTKVLSGILAFTHNQRALQG